MSTQLDARRSLEELKAIAKKRGRQLKRRRFGAIAGVAAVAAVLAIGGTVAAVSGPQPSDRVVADGGAPSRTERPEPPTTTVVVAPTTVVVVPTTVPSTTSSAPTTTMASVPPPALCDRSGIQTTVATNKPSYATGDSVNWSSLLKNVSTKDCAQPLPVSQCAVHVDTHEMNCTQSDTIVDGPMPVLGAGDEITSTGTWDRLAPGRYVVSVEWESVADSSGNASRLTAESTEFQVS